MHLDIHVNMYVRNGDKQRRIRQRREEGVVLLLRLGKRGKKGLEVKARGRGKVMEELAWKLELSRHVVH